MARTPAAPPAEEPEADTVYNEIWATVTGSIPDFAEPGDAEDDQDYFKRLSQAIADATEPDASGNSEVWANMSVEAQAWYDSTVSAAEQGQDYPAPDGYYADDAGEEEPEAEAEPEPEPAPKAKSGREALMAFNAKRKADKEAAAAAAPAPVAAPRRTTAPAPAPAPVAAPRRTTAPAPVVAPPTAARRTPVAARAPAAAPAPAPRRVAAPATPSRAVPVRAAAPRAAAPAKRTRAAAAPAVDKPDSGTKTMRKLIIMNPEITTDQIIDYMAEHYNVEPKRTTVISMLTATRTVVDAVKELGYWQEAS